MVEDSLNQIEIDSCEDVNRSLLRDSEIYKAEASTKITSLQQQAADLRREAKKQRIKTFVYGSGGGLLGFVVGYIVRAVKN